MLYSPEYTIPAGVELTLDYFFDDTTSATIVLPALKGTVEIGVITGSITWTLLKTMSTASAWQKTSIDLSSYVGSNVIFKFTSEALKSIPGGSFVIATVAIDTPIAVCDDGYDCTEDTCSTSSPFGCVNDASPPNSYAKACSNVYPATCFTKTCDPTNGEANADGCVVTPNNTYCDDGIDCTNDKCFNTSTTDGCTHTPDNSNCDDGSACTDNICDPTKYSGSTGCGFPSNCDDGIT
jgi:hypothetical protein